MSEIAGVYKHFKGRYYTLICIAYDKYNNKFILYRANYGNKEFWIRPYDMFFEDVTLESGEVVKRFAPTNAARTSMTFQINKIISLIKERSVVIKDSEMDKNYVITAVSEEEGYMTVNSVNDSYSSGYLTEYELAQRLGYDLCMINNSVDFVKKKEPLQESKQLKIGENNIDDVKKFLNPCSIDLQIADSGYLKPKHKLVDVQSIEHVSSANGLWERVKVYRSKKSSSSYIKLKPGMIVLTHTKERIKIPKDCAGKIEIKSTFARLSLSITTGDFCNPGYDGFFPLEIKNNGKHTIIIHQGETMAQLMLLPLQGPILNEYQGQATFINQKGFDDGTPYSFWNERSIKALRKEKGTQEVIELFHNVLEVVNKDNTEDVNGFKERFSDSFLPFCQKKLSNIKYRDENKNIPSARGLLTGYIRKEKFLKNLFKIKGWTGLASIFIAAVPMLVQAAQGKIAAVGFGSFMLSVAPWIIVALLVMAVAIILFVVSPKVFCTFEKIDIDELLAMKEVREQTGV